MTSLHLRPVQFVDTPIGHPDGSVARLAGGMQWFAAYEVIERGARRTIPVADVAMLGDRAAQLHAMITAPRAPLPLGDRVLRFDQPLVAAILNVTPDRSTWPRRARR
jgi:dihydropteroate synthase